LGLILVVEDPSTVLPRTTESIFKLMAGQDIGSIHFELNQNWVSILVWSLLLCNLTQVT
jgi:hypothetical protein